MLGTLRAAADPTPMPLTMIGVGPHGYDFLVGHWKCVGNITLPSGQVVRQISIDDSYRAGAGGSISLDESGSGVLIGREQTDKNGPTDSAPTTESIKYTRTGRLRYAAETQKWSMTFAVPTGAIGQESTRDTGENAVWTGSEVRADGSPFNIRDTVMFSGPSSYVDKSELQVGQTWLVLGNVTCSKS